MVLEYFYITNSPKVALACEKSGVDRIFVDMEYIGKDKRQGGMDTVKNHHTAEDVRKIKSVIKKSKLLVRINPVYQGSKKEIDDVIDAGADYIMLPMWKTVEDVKEFTKLVAKRASTMLLLETDEARLCLDEVLKLGGIDEIYIGLNDLHLSQHKKFMFELYTDGTVDEIVDKVKSANIKFGIGGVGKVNCDNLLPAENILCEHYRLGSSMAILARSFCDWTKCDVKEFEEIMKGGIEENRQFESIIQSKPKEFFETMHKETAKIIDKIKVSKNR